MSDYYDRCGGALFVVGGSKGGGILIVVSANWSLAFNDVIEFWDGKGEKYSHARTSSSNFCDGISDLRKFEGRSRLTALSPQYFSAHASRVRLEQLHVRVPPDKSGRG